MHLYNSRVIYICLNPHFSVIQFNTFSETWCVDTCLKVCENPRDIRKENPLVRDYISSNKNADRFNFAFKITVSHESEGHKALTKFRFQTP